MATLPFFRQGATPEPFEIQRIYVAGSSVFATIYEDAALTVVLGNSLSVPIQANSEGLYPPIFVSGDIAYDIKFFTQDGYSKDTYEGIVAQGGIVSDAYKVMTYSGDTDPDYLQNKLVAGNNISISLSGNDLVLSASTTSADDHKVLVDSIDPTPGFLFDKVVPGPFVTVAKTAGVSGEAIAIAFRPVVSADGTDVPNYLKVS